MTSTPDGSSRRTTGADAVDVLLDAVAHPHRRHLLSRLHAGDGPLTVTEVATAIADGGDAAGRPEVSTVVASFHHVHLPKLTGANLVEYDADAGTVRRGGRTAEAAQYLLET